MRRTTLCQTCFCTVCAWHTMFKPVEGWEATPTELAQPDGKIISSFDVIKCPLYKERAQDAGWTEVTKTDFVKMLKLDAKSFSQKFMSGDLWSFALKRGYLFKTYGDEENNLAWFIKRR